jgi:tungstate transport system substrate-binding protein
VKKFCLVFLVVLLGLSACATATPAATPAPAPENPVIRMSTTTSVNDSGLMGYLQPVFEADTGYQLEITSAGTGAAIEKGRMGDADILLVHSKSAEEEFINEGFDEVRVPFMTNYFIVVGPADDPAGVEGSTNAAEAFARIAEKGATFITRGDKSGTNNKELAIWKNAEIDPEGKEWYVNIGAGMGQALTVASEQQAYTLSDKATYLAAKTDLSLLLETADDMLNTYSMIAISPARFADTNIAGAEAFIEWIKTDKAKGLIAEYGKEEFGQQLFYNLEK